jgi:hypothetical protein
MACKYNQKYFLIAWMKEEIDAALAIIEKGELSHI